MTNTDIESELLIKAINNEIRRNIIRLLMGKSMNYTEIAHLLGFNLKKESGKFNFHLRQLLEVGIVDNTAENEGYQLTEKGKEMYYLLLDIERDTEIDPHGMMIALIRLNGSQEFWFYSSSLGMIAALWSLLLGLVALFLGGDENLNLWYGGITIGLGIGVGFFSTRYYVKTVKELLGVQSRLSKLFSTILFLSLQWYLIRAKNRITYLLTTFIILFGWYVGLLAGLLHVTEGRESVGMALNYLEIMALLLFSVGSIAIRNLYLSSQRPRNSGLISDQPDI